VGRHNKVFAGVQELITAGQGQWKSTS